MGFSVSAATAIIFTGIVVMAGIMSATVFQVYGDLKDAALAASDAEFDRQRTRIEVLNSTYNSTMVFINVTNSGETTLDARFVDVLIDGAILTEDLATRSVSGTGSRVWGVHEVMYLEVSYTKAIDGSRVKVVTENGASGSGLVK
jgi:flagellar protein FlaF